MGFRIHVAACYYLLNFVIVTEALGWEAEDTTPKARRLELRIFRFESLFLIRLKTHRFE